MDKKETAHPVWTLFIFALWWNGIGGLILSVFAILSLCSFIKPFGDEGFPLNTTEHIFLLVACLYLFAIWIIYLRRHRQAFQDQAVVRWRYVSAFLFVVVIMFSVFAHQNERLKDEIRAAGIYESVGRMIERSNNPSSENKASNRAASAATA